MRILMLSWEYPPKSVGGLSTHVYFLAKSLKKLGHEVHVITCNEEGAETYEEDFGVFVHRVSPYLLDTEDFTKWVMHLNFAMVEEAVKLINKSGKFDIIHSHDWLSLYSSKLLKWTYNIPLICTIHATEHGRNSGIRTDMQKYISSAEWLLTFESWKVIACSQYMKEEIKNIFTLPEDKIEVIPNGIDMDSFNLQFDKEEFRKKYALDDEKIIFCIGRHVYEKGVQLLIEAAPDIINNCENTKFIIAGKGEMTEGLKERVRGLGLEKKILFVGYMENEEKIKMYKVADAAVVPSLYEPFGIVALEAMAAGCPVVISDVGGLKELVEHKVNGLKAVAGSRDSLRDNLLMILKDEELHKAVGENCNEFISNKYNWDNIALETSKLYEKVQDEAKETEWEVKDAKPKKKSAGIRKKKATEEVKKDIKEEQKAVKEKVTKVRKTRKTI